MNEIEKHSIYLAKNLEILRRKRNLSQLELAKVAGIPRTTLTNMESGEGNPSLSNLSKVCGALGVGIEEILSRPRNECQLIQVKDIPLIEKRGVSVFKLLPDKIKGLEIDRMEFKPNSSMGGKPHLAGSKEYMTILKGEVSLHISGEKYVIKKGEVFAFPGDQPHSYQNTKSSSAVALSVVIPVPLHI